MSQSLQNLTGVSSGYALRRATFALATAGLCAVVAGCGSQIASITPEANGITITGKVHGGQQPLIGAKIYLYAASNSGYGAASTSLLANPGYVTSDGSGSFTITGTYTCPAGAYVYLVALGGNPGLAPGTNNAKLGLMSGLGACSALTPTTFTLINEVTTVATAYALAGFTTSATQIGTSSTNSQGMINAFNNLTNLYDIGAAQAKSAPTAGNGIVPQAEINSLANAIASCVNTDGTGSPCASLMTAANVTGAGGTPIDTNQAAINIAHNPGTNVATIYNLSTPNAVFQPMLAAAPNDWTVTVSFTANFNQVQGMAVDAVGNLYFSNSLGANMTELSPTGVNITPASGLTSPSMNRPQQIGIDLLGNIWTESRAFTSGGGTNFAASVQKFSPNGTLLSGATGFTGSALNTPRGLAIDASNNVWALGTSEMSLFNNAGAPLAPTGYTASNGASNLQTSGWSVGIDNIGTVWAIGFDRNTGAPSITKFAPLIPPAAQINGVSVLGNYQPMSISFDSSDNAWVGAFLGGPSGTGSVLKYSNNGTLLSPSAGFPTPTTNESPNDVFVDGVGNVFTSQSGITEFTPNGTVISPNLGYQPTQTTDCCLTGAIDASGNLWMTGVTSVYQMLGMAAPVVTPTVLAVKNGTRGTRP